MEANKLVHILKKVSAWLPGWYRKTNTNYKYYTFLELAFQVFCRRIRIECSLASSIVWFNADNFFERVNTRFHTGRITTPTIVLKHRLLSLKQEVGKMDSRVGQVCTVRYVKCETLRESWLKSCIRRELDGKEERTSILTSVAYSSNGKKHPVHFENS